MTSSTPYEHLRDLDRRARGAGAAAEVAEGPKGVLLRLGALEILAPMTEVVEIIPPPPLAHVPGAKSWVLGVGNLHGELLPVFDLAAFLTGTPTPREERLNRILVVERSGARAGLLVEAVLGQRVFAGDESIPPPAVSPVLAPWLIAGWRLDGKIWPVIGLWRVVDSAVFQDVAA